MTNQTRREKVGLAVRLALIRFSRTAAAKESKLWWLVLLALAVDLGSTIYGFRLGFVEQNYLARILLANFGLVGILGLKFAALTLAVALRRIVPSEHVGLIPLALGIPWWIGALTNTVLIAALLF